MCAGNLSEDIEGQFTMKLDNIIASKKYIIAYLQYNFCCHKMMLTKYFR